MTFPGLFWPSKENCLGPSLTRVGNSKFCGDFLVESEDHTVWEREAPQLSMML